MQKDYASIAQFEQFKIDRALPALSVVGVNLKNKNKLDNVAAIMLGYLNYSALQPLHLRERRIRNHFYMEECQFQQGNKTIKAANILVVFDSANKVIRFRALAPKEEAEQVTDLNQFSYMPFDGPVESVGFFSDIRISPDNDNDDPSCLSIIMLLPDATGQVAEYTADIIRTEEGLVLNVFTQSNGDWVEFDTMDIAFDDADSAIYELVDQAAAPYLSSLSSIHGEYYQWLMPTQSESGIEHHHIDKGGDYHALSALQFATYDEAVAAVVEGAYGYGASDVEGAIIVKVNKAFAGKPNLVS